MITLEAIDQGGIHPFRHLRDALPWLMPVVIGLVYLGSRYVVLGVALLAGGVMAARGLRRPAVLLLVTVGVALGLGYATQVVVDRPRPNNAWEVAAPLDARSFPSTTALAAAALFGSLALLLARRATPGRARAALLAAGFVLPLLAGAACLVAGHNYVSDVLAGWAAGAALALLCGRADEAASRPS